MVNIRIMRNVSKFFFIRRNDFTEANKQVELKLSQQIQKNVWTISVHTISTDSDHQNGIHLFYKQHLWKDGCRSKFGFKSKLKPLPKKWHRHRSMAFLHTLFQCKLLPTINNNLWKILKKQKKFIKFLLKASAQSNVTFWSFVSSRNRVEKTLLKNSG